MAKRKRSKGSGTLFKRQGRGPWIASWYDHDGKRRERSTRTTDRAAAERILAKHVADAALRRDGVIDANRDRFAVEGRRPLAEHIAAYIAHCRRAGQASRHVDQKDDHLRRLSEGARVTRLADLTADALERHLTQLRHSGLSARSVNFARQIAVAFYQWAVKTGRAEINPLRVVPKLDESRDRRRVRRPLTDAEMASLIAVAREHGREAWYLAAALAGLRKGDLQRLTWADVDFDDATITVREGKAKRVDLIPMHPQLAEALQRRFAERPAVGAAKVFPETVTDRTRLRDFLRAGIAREEIVRDGDGEPVMVGSGKRRRPKTRIVAEDDDGKVIDLHALRTTLGTQLARAGVAPQIAQRIMRHSDYKTTLAHYTVLGLTDTSKAVEALPAIRTHDDGSERATGTHAEPTDAGGDPQLYPQQLERGTERTGANRRAERRATGTDAMDATPTKNGPYGPLDAKRATGLEPATFSLEG
jgi:integrase